MITPPLWTNQMWAASTYSRGQLAALDHNKDAGPADHKAIGLGECFVNVAR
jgi:hypothetical protein